MYIKPTPSVFISQKQSIYEKTEQYDEPLPMLPNDPPLRAVRAFEAIARLGDQRGG